MPNNPLQLNPEKDVELRQKVNRETARLPWSELMRHFASGNVVWVADELDLVEVAVRVGSIHSSVGWMCTGCWSTPDGLYRYGAPSDVAPPLYQSGADRVALDVDPSA